MEENINNQGAVMKDEIALYEALMKANYEGANNPKDVEISETFKAAIRLVSQQSDVITELPNLGVYEPYTPKTNYDWRFYFNTLNAHTTIFVQPGNADIVNNIRISVDVNKLDRKVNEINTTLGDNSLSFLGYEVTESFNNSILSNIKFIYEYKNKPNINVAVLINNLSDKEINDQVKSQLPPKNFSKIYVYQTKKDKLYSSN